MKEKFKLDFDEMKRIRMGMILGFNPDDMGSWPFDLIDRLIAGELEHGLEWVFAEYKRATGPSK